MTNEKTLEVEELQILMNILGEQLRISYPLYNFTMIEVEPNEDLYKLDVQSNREDFVKSFKYGDFQDEMPSHNDVFECLLNSGVIQYCNLNEFKKKLGSWRNFKRAVYFSPDTNILYHGFLSNSNLIKPEEILLVNTVRDEIESSLNYKYDNYQINNLKKMTKLHVHLLDELRNRRIKRSRRAAYLAMQDFRSIRDKATRLEPVKESTPDNRENDLTIARTLRKYGEEKSSLPVLITADNLMPDICETEGIEYFHFKIPHKIEFVHCTAKQLRKLIFNLAGLFGFIKLNNTILFGEYKGKTSPSELKARFLNNRVFQEFERELKICRKLKKLGISK